MTLSEFHELVTHVFGRQLGNVIFQEQVISELGDRTAQEALNVGIIPKIVWRALCDAMDVPESDRWISYRETR